MAYYMLEPFGEGIADARHGVATSVLANINRNATARPEPYTAQDFIYWRNREPVDDEDDLVLLDDPVAQSNLIRAAMFGKAPE